MAKERDYNIENYTDEEILDILGFRKKPSDINQKIDKTIDKLKLDHKNQKVIEFLESAKERLAVEKEKNLKDELLTNANPLNNPKPVTSSSVPGVNSHYVKKKLTSVLSFNTLFRHNYFNTKPNAYDVKFPSAFKNVVAMKLASLELFNSWYNIRADIGTNTFAYEISGNRFTVEIASGNPDADSLIKQINETFQNNGHSGVLKCEYDFDTQTVINTQKTGRVIFNYTGTGTFKLDFTNDKLTNPIPMISLGWMMGFRNIIYESNYDASGNSPKITYISESILNLAGTPYIYVAVEDYQPSVNDTVVGIFSDSLLSKRILARIPVNASSNNVIYDDVNRDNYKSREYFGPVNIERIKISLLDQYGNLLELNDIDYSLSIEFTMLHSI